MKKILFFFGMFASITASTQVTHVEPVGADYASKTVSFRVWWNAGSRDATHLSKVWVWIDYIKVNSNNTTSGNTWTRAAVSAASPTASVSYDGSNRQGFWLQGNSGSYSATVTVQLNITETKFNWCAYASDYPPNVTLDKGTYTFKGTTNFLVSSHAQPLTSKTIVKASLTVNSSSTFTDATGCPGIGSIYCPYTGSDLYMDATHLCQQRTSGAKNWEAWIKDTRDDELYRVILMPDNKWWLAQNVKFVQTGEAVTAGGCTPDKCGRRYTGVQMSQSWGGTSGYGSGKQGVCPNGWVLPVNSDYANLTSSISATASVVAARLQAEQSICSGGNNYYGWASVIGISLPNLVINSGFECWRTNDSVNWEYGLFLNHIPNSGVMTCGAVAVGHSYANMDRVSSVRCFRQL
jgi:uncharacterized protein (TIGR02145 family)